MRQVEPPAALTSPLDEAALHAMEAPVDSPERLACATCSARCSTILAMAMFVGIWQALRAAAIWPEYRLPAPATVWAQIAERVANGEILGFL